MATSDPWSSEGRERSRPISEIVAKLNALAPEGGAGDAETRDPEKTHGVADQLLLEAVHPDVRAAYEALVERSPWWATG